MPESVLLFAPGWHRKWVVLLIALVAGFLNRYRLMGLLLSKAIAFYLAKQQRERKGLDFSVHAKLVLLRPIQFVHVEMKSASGDWTLLFTKITLYCYIKEFFHSFGQTKMFVLEIENVVGELHRLDETLLRELLHQKPWTHAANANSAAPTNPIGFLRFVDFQVGSIRLMLRCFGVATEFRCRALSVGITDVLVAQNLLYAKVQASSTYLRAYREAREDAQNAEGVIKDGIRFNCPSLCLIAELQLMDPKMVGFKLVGNKEDLVSFQLCTSFLDFLLLKRLELVQKGLFQRSDVSAQTAKPLGTELPADGSSERILARDISDLHFSVTVIHELQDQIIVPVQFAAEIGYLSTRKIDISATTELRENLNLEFGNKMVGAHQSSGDHMHATVSRIHVKAGRDFKQDIFSMSTLEINATQTHQERRTLTCTVGDVEMLLSPRIGAVFYSLVAAGDRFKGLNHDAAAQTKQARSELVRSQASSRDSRQLVWDVDVKTRSWTVKVVHRTKSLPAEELVVVGLNTVMTTKIAPSDNTESKQHEFQIDEIRANVTTRCDKEKQAHCILFTGAELALMKDVVQSPQYAKLTSVEAKFRSIAVNGVKDGGADTTSHFPVAYMKDVLIKKQDKRGEDAMDTDISVMIAESHIYWSHRRHEHLLLELSAISAIIDKLDSILAPPRSIPSPSALADDKAQSHSHRAPEVLKTFTLDLRSKNIEIMLYDVYDVAQLVALRLKDVLVVHQKTKLAVQSSFKCAQFSLLWGASLPAIELYGASFTQKVLLGPQLLVAKIPVQTIVKATRMAVFVRPGFRLLLLLLRFDGLFNPKKQVGDNQSAERKTSRQRASLECTQVAVEIHEKSVGDADESKNSIYHVISKSLEIKTVISKQIGLAESIAALMKTLQRDGPSGQLAFTETTYQTLGVEGCVSMSSLTMLRFSIPVAEFCGVETRFAMTDIVRLPTSSEKKAGSCRTLVFDCSALAKYCKVTAEKKLAERLAKISPAIRDTFDTQEEVEQDEMAAVEPTETNWRQRYVGNVDVGVEECDVLLPYGDTLSSGSIVDSSYRDIGKRLMHVTIRDATLNLRQFQKLAFQFSSLRVLLEELSDDHAGTSPRLENDPPLQFIYLPQVKLDALVHWVSSKKNEFGNEAESTSISQNFAVSIELTMKSKKGSGPVTQVPVEEEVLIALNWDYVYPLLVYYLTEDEEDSLSASNSSQVPKEPTLKCIGFQWDASIDFIQMSWWDVMTKEVGLLVVAQDFLSHGTARNIQSTELLETQSIDAARSAWVVDEATNYLDVFRAYMLRNPLCDTDIGAMTIVESELLPFDTTKTSNFFFETVGTSYKISHSLDEADDDSVGDELESLFREYGKHCIEAMHDDFKPIDFGFSLFGSRKLRRSGSLAAMPPVIPIVTPLPATTVPSSPAKPKSWTQAVRAKLTRLKRRPSSMDNLLLDDGSSPIQVDSMKLLWTIETRDTVFYISSLTVDSMQRLLEAKQQQEVRSQTTKSNTGSDSNSGQAPSIKTDTLRPCQSTSSSQKIKESSLSGAPSCSRRGSARDTLLDLLQQGKLGVKPVDLPDEEGSSGSDVGNEAKRPSMPGESEDMSVSKSVAFKQYTVDVHDAQINIREDNSRSSILVATKRIHLEMGLDEVRSHTIAHLRFDSLTGHIAPIDVDVSAGVLWYAHSASSPAHASRVQSSGSSLLKQVMEECSLTMTYSQALANGATAVEIDLSFLQLSTDRHQFYQLLNVVRHVLLAPPTAVRKSARAQTHARNATNSTQDLEASELTMLPASPSLHPHSTKKNHAQLIEELRNREAKQMNSRANVIALKFISFRAEGSQFRLRSSPESTGVDFEFVEIRIQGVAGSHTYYASQCAKLILNLQWIEVNNLHPGPSSIAFEDAMAVFKAKLLFDKRYQSSSKVNLKNQKGMLTVRAESGPLIRVLGQKLRVLDVLEVSIFPEISNMIIIQLASDFYELVYKFFFEQLGPQDHHDIDSEQVLFGRKAGGDNDARGHISPCMRGRSATSATPASLVPVTSKARRKSVQMSGPTNSLLIDPNASFVSNVSTASMSASQSVALDSASVDDDDSSADGCELFYFKYVRIGNVRLRINCNGFFVNLSDFDLDLPPYVCQSKLCTTKKLLQKFESHLKWYVTKESASSGLSHFKNKFLKWTPTSSSSTTEKKDKNKKDEDSSTMNAQVLFGPYSGAAT